MEDVNTSAETMNSSNIGSDTETVNSSNIGSDTETVNSSNIEPDTETMNSSNIEPDTETMNSSNIEPDTETENSVLRSADVENENLSLIEDHKTMIKNCTEIIERCETALETTNKIDQVVTDGVLSQALADASTNSRDSHKDLIKEIMKSNWDAKEIIPKVKTATLKFEEFIKHLLEVALILPSNNRGPVLERLQYLKQSTKELWQEFLENASKLDRALEFLTKMKTDIKGKNSSAGDVISEE